ncbi:MAG: DUF3375 family protein [Candidatus Promineifilaceae bacterium]
MRLNKGLFNFTTNPPDNNSFLWIEATPATDMPLERSLWTPPITTSYTTAEPTTIPLDLSGANLEALFSQFYVDESRLRRHLSALLEQRAVVTLGEVTAVYPIVQGLAELVTYMALAARHEAHEIDAARWEDVELRENGRVVRLPLVIFKKEAQSNGKQKEPS